MEEAHAVKVGDTFENDFQEYTVIGTSPADEKVLCENMAGMTEWMHDHELLGLQFK